MAKRQKVKKVKKEKKPIVLPKFHLRMPRGYDFIMHLAILLLMLFGSIMIASTYVGVASSKAALAAQQGYTVNPTMTVIKAIVKQLIFVFVSFIIMQFLAANFTRFLAKDTKIQKDLEIKQNQRLKKVYRSLYRYIGFGLFGLCVATLFFPAVNGAHCWIDLKVMTIQPTEFAKVYMIILIGLVVNDYSHYLLPLWTYCKEMLFFFVPVVILILIQPDLGTLIVFLVITGICLLIPTNPSLKPIRILVLVCFVLLFGAVIFCTSDFGLTVLDKFDLGYKLARFKNAVDPFEDIYGDGYNIVYSLYAVAHGGLSGLGLGASEQKFGYLPEAQTDFIFSVTMEELGLVGLAIIIVCYGIIIYKLLYYALKTKSEGYKVILIGCVAYLVTHFVLNVGGVTALIPLTGVPLLFISSGGSSLMSIMALLGVCQSIISLTRAQMAQLKKNT